MIDRPYFFRYAEDAATDISDLLDKAPPQRPVVPVSLAHLGRSTVRVSALVDSGSERVFAAPGLARALQLDLSAAPSGKIGLGGRPRQVRFATVSLRLYEDLLKNDDPEIAEWDVDVAFLTNWEPTWAVLLGRDGFFNRFTVTMHGGVPGMVLEPWETFDERYQRLLVDAETAQPRYKDR